MSISTHLWLSDLGQFTCLQNETNKPGRALGLQEEGASRIAGLFLSRLRALDAQEMDFEPAEAGDYSDLIAREDSVLC